MHLQKSYIIINGKKLNTFSLRSGTRQRFPLLPLLSSTTVLCSSQWDRQEKEIKIYRLEIEKKLCLFANKMIVYIEHFKEFEKGRGFLELRVSLAWSQIQSQYSNINSILYGNNGHLDVEIFLNTIYNSSKREMTRYKSFQICADSVCRKLQNTNKKGTIK